MRPAQFIAALRQGKVGAAYFLRGPDRFLHEECRNAIVQVLPADTREWCLQTMEFSPGALAHQLESAQQMPMLGGHNFLIFSDPEDFRRASDEDTEALDRYLARPAPFSTVIFAAIEPDRRRRFVQLLEKKAETVELTPLTEHEAVAWIREYSAGAGFQLDAKVPEALVERFVMPPAQRTGATKAVNLLWLRTELDKLLAAKHDAKRIEMQDLKLVAGLREEYEVGKMLRALAERRCDEALRLLQALLAGKVAETLVLWCIADMFRQALKVVSSGSGGRASWSSRSNPYATWEIAPLARRYYSVEELAGALRLTRQADLGIKSSWKDSHLLLEMLIWQITSGKGNATNLGGWDAAAGIAPS